MRTIWIMTALTATVIGLSYAGVINMDPVVSRAVDIAQRIELLDREPRTIIVGLDITAGREGELEKDRRAIGEIIHRAGQGDRISVYLIHSRAESEQEAVFSAALPDSPGPSGQVLARAKKEADARWESCWEKRVLSLTSSDKTQRTDLFGFMRFVAAQRPEFADRGNAYLVLFTDGQQVGDGFNMEKKAPGRADLEKAERLELIPELDGVRVQFAGVTPTHRIDNEHWRRIQTFWKEYGSLSGAKSVSVTSERNIRM